MRGWSTAGFDGGLRARRCRRWCWVIQARPANGGYAAMDMAVRYRRFLDIRSGTTPRSCVRVITERKREKSMDRLKGKTALVVGAGSIGPGWGNGKATA